jgi:hypothetical protein
VLARRSARSRPDGTDEPELLPAVPLSGSDPDDGEAAADWAAPAVGGAPEPPAPDWSRGPEPAGTSSGFSPPDDNSFWAPPAEPAGRDEGPEGTGR